MVITYYELGDVTGPASMVRFRKVMVESPGKDTVEALQLERPKAGQYETPQFGVLDFDELPAFRDAVDSIIRLTATWPDKPDLNAQAMFESRGGVRVGYSQKPYFENAFLTVNQYGTNATASFPIAKLKQVRDLYQKAIDKLIELGAK